MKSTHRAVAVVLVVGTLCLGLASVARAQTEAQDEGMRDAHRTLQLATAGSLLVTGALGTIVAINKPTLFGEGRCESGDPLFGEYGCHGLSVVHGLSAIVSLVLYTATTAIEIAEFDWPGRDDHGAVYEAASWVHLGGMAILPIAGIITVVPQVLGMQEAPEFQRIMRTLHLTFAYATVGSYVATVAVEL